jgi:hypothetical protein
MPPHLTTASDRAKIKIKASDPELFHPPIHNRKLYRKRRFSSEIPFPTSHGPLRQPA